MSGPFQMSTALRRTFSIFASEVRVVLAIVAIAYLPVILGVFGLMAWGAAEPQRSVEIQLYFTVGVTLSGLVFQYLTIGASIDAVFRRLRGREAHVGSSLRLAVRRFFPLLGLAILVGLAAGVGMLFCLVPGIYLQCCLYAATPALIVEDSRIGEAWRRSFDLTSGYRWEVFGVLLVLGGIGMIAGILVELLAPAAATTTDSAARLLVYLPVSLAVTLVVTAVSAVASVVVYHDLRLAKEGLDEEELVAVFA
jgi:hypothetical protein